MNCTSIMHWEEVLTTHLVDGSPRVGSTAVVVTVFNAPTLHILIDVLLRFLDVQFSFWGLPLATAVDGDVLPMPLSFTVHIENMTILGFEEELAAFLFEAVGHRAYREDLGTFNSMEALQEMLEKGVAHESRFPDLDAWLTSGRKTSDGLDKEGIDS